MFLGCQKGVRLALVPRQSGADATGVKTVTSFTAGQTIGTYAIPQEGGCRFVVLELVELILL